MVPTFPSWLQPSLLRTLEVTYLISLKIYPRPILRSPKYPIFHWGGYGATRHADDWTLPVLYAPPHPCLVQVHIFRRVDIRTLPPSSKLHIVFRSCFRWPSWKTGGLRRYAFQPSVRGRTKWHSLPGLANGCARGDRLLDSRRGFHRETTVRRDRWFVLR